MNKTIKFYGIIFLAVLGLLAFFELGKKEITDWRKNFDIAEKTPFGLYIFNQEIDKLLGEKVERINNSPYEFYNKNPKLPPHTILLIQKEIDGESWNKILSELHKGSDAIILSTFCNKKIKDSLGFSLSPSLYDEQSVYELTDKKLKNAKLQMDKFPGIQAISYIDKKNDILGKMKIDSAQWKANFIKVKIGNGNLYFHSDPTIVTNYYLLQPNSNTYIEGVFSYLKNQKTIWFLDTNATERSSSPLSFILNNPPLKYAWWLLLGSLLVFVIFGVKRKQRVVPIIEPLKNKSVEFVQSIGNLYLQEGDFHDMMSKKAHYFLFRIKSELLIDYQKLDDNFAMKIHQKTGKDLKKISKAVLLLNKAMDSYAQVTKEDFLEMNFLLDEIYPPSRI